MQKKNGNLILSPSDLTRFLGSEFVTWMDRFTLEFPCPGKSDPENDMSKILQKKGIEHEQEYLRRLETEGRDVCDVSIAADRFAATAEAMKSGRDVIYQAALQDQSFVGYADFLVKASGDSKLGNYHYEPWDTKLALKAKPYFLVQLACYADLLQSIQGVLPGHVHVVFGDKQLETFRTEDYFYYYRQLRQALINQQSCWKQDEPPDFIGLEDFGRWTTLVQRLMEEQDHLCRVASIRSVQIKKLHRAGITTMTQLAQSKLDTVGKMQPATFGALKQQARLQIESKGLARQKYELILPPVAGQGLTILAPPSRLDVYFDMEGYPLVDGGLEYLFGATVLENGIPNFIDWWAHDSEQEKRAFEEFVDWVYERWQKDSSMHVYHYASYEKTALRKLMGKYGTREKEVDDLLRQEVFIDLYVVVRQSIRVGEPNYSIKSIEHLYKGRREGDVSTALDSVAFYQEWLDHKDGDDWQTSDILREIRAYNKEDCDSTWQLTQWLRKVQQEHRIEFQRKEEKAAPQSSAAQFRTTAWQLASEMLDGIPLDPSSKTESMRLRELLAYLLEFHWREAKPVFWAKYDRHEMTEEELFDDPSCLSGLLRNRTAPRAVARSFHYDYSFDPNQDTKIDAQDKCFFAHDLNEKITIAEIDADNGKVTLKRKKSEAAPPERLSLIRNEYVDASTIAQSIYRTAEALMGGRALPPALEDFLSRRTPRVQGWSGGPLIPPGKDLTVGASDVISRLASSTLCIQGPPGSGKTYTAAQAIAALLGSGKRVGITSNSHKAIAHLMDKVAEAVSDRKEVLRAVKLQSALEDFHVQSTGIHSMTPKDLFDSGPGHFGLIGGTAWVFSNEAAAAMLDYLFVDEAGQVSVANLVGMAPSARNLVLIGDQMQLSQPLQGTHPGESGQSVLQYLLQGRQVIPDDFGIFLGTSWRMHPDVCSFISGAVYEDRLHSQPHTADRVIVLPKSKLVLVNKPSGILYVPVAHEGNAQDSEEEANAIVQIVAELRKCSRLDGSKRSPVVLDDMLIVAPYNMQVRRLQAALPGARVGSVDKFQGQEAPIVIISMCSSSGDASPRGLEFIFSKNRLNVAISRAQSLAIVVGSPVLARTHCSRVEQIELVNLFCRIVEAGSRTTSSS